MTTSNRSTRSNAWGFLPVGSVRAQGWFLEQMRTDLAGFAGRLDQLSTEARSDIFVHGRLAGGNWRHWWNAETESKWIDGLTRLAHVSGDAEQRLRSQEYFRRILDAAEADGYIGIYTREWRDAGGSRSAELWTQSMMLCALLAEWEATDDDDLFDAIVRAVELTLNTYDPATGIDPFVGDITESQLFGHNLFMVEPILWLHEITGDQRYLDFALSCHARYETGSIRWLEADGFSARMSDREIPYLGHGAHTAVQVRIPLLFFRATRDERWRAMYEAGLEKLERYSGTTGALKSDECVGSETHEGLPFPESGYEYCTITEQLHSLHFAYAITRDGTYADQAELIAFNAAQGARRHDGGGIAYLSSDNQTDASRDSGPRYKYSPVHSDVAVCCSPSATRMLAHHVSRAVLADGDDGVTIAFYGPLRASTAVQGTAVDLTIDTAYPFENEVRITVDPESPVEFALTLRVPGWSTATTIDAESMTAARFGDGTVTIRRTWLPGTPVTVSFDARPVVVRAVDGTVAMQRGALVFALEIPHRETLSGEYPGGFFDSEFRPTGRANWHLSLALDPDRLSESVDVVTSDPADSADPFAVPPIKLQVVAYDAVPFAEEGNPVAEPVIRPMLVPFGSTRLRRTTFPLMPAPRPLR